MPSDRKAAEITPDILSRFAEAARKRIKAEDGSFRRSVEWKLRGPKFAFLFRSGSPGRIRTSDQPVNSRLLYH